MEHEGNTALIYFGADWHQMWFPTCGRSAPGITQTTSKATAMPPPSCYMDANSNCPGRACSQAITNSSLCRHPPCGSAQAVTACPAWPRHQHCSPCAGTWAGDMKAEGRVGCEGDVPVWEYVVGEDVNSRGRDNIQCHHQWCQSVLDASSPFVQQWFQCVYEWQLRK